MIFIDLYVKKKKLNDHCCVGNLDTHHKSQNATPAFQRRNCSYEDISLDRIEIKGALCWRTKFFRYATSLLIVARYACYLISDNERDLQTTQLQTLQTMTNLLKKAENIIKEIKEKHCCELAVIKNELTSSRGKPFSSVRSRYDKFQTFIIYQFYCLYTTG